MLQNSLAPSISQKRSKTVNGTQYMPPNVFCSQQVPSTIDFHLQLLSLLDDVMDYLSLKALNDTKHLMSHWEKQPSSLAGARRKDHKFPSLSVSKTLKQSHWSHIVNARRAALPPFPSHAIEQLVLHRSVFQFKAQQCHLMLQRSAREGSLG